MNVNILSHWIHFERFCFYYCLHMWLTKTCFPRGNSLNLKSTWRSWDKKVWDCLPKQLLNWSEGECMRSLLVLKQERHDKSSGDLHAPISFTSWSSESDFCTQTLMRWPFPFPLGITFLQKLVQGFWVLKNSVFRSFPDPIWGISLVSTQTLAGECEFQRETASEWMSAPCFLQAHTLTYCIISALLEPQEGLGEPRFLVFRFFDKLPLCVIWQRYNYP